MSTPVTFEIEVDTAAVGVEIDDAASVGAAFDADPKVVFAVVRGEQGDAGPQGPQGNVGPPGAQGPQGNTGAPGSVIHTGTGTPNSVLGVPGDYYIDGATDILYGPKQSANLGAPEQAFGSQTPGADGYSNGYSLGNQLHFNTSGQIVALRFWRVSGSATHNRLMYVWNPTTHALIATAQQSSETSTMSGWIELPLATPVTVAVDDEFVISYDSPQDETFGYISPANPSDTADITHVRGFYLGTQGAFPATSGGAVNYLADVSFRGVAATPWPTVTDLTGPNPTETVVAIGVVGAASTISLTNGTFQTATLTPSTATTFTMPTATAGKAFKLLLKQPAATGGGTASFTGVRWSAGTAPTITAGAGKMDILTFIADGVNWYGNITQNYTY